MDNKTNLRSYLVMAFLSLVWGSSFILIKKGLENFEPVELASLRIIFAFIVLIPVLIMNLKKINRRDFFYCSVVGLFGNLLPAFLFAFAQTNLKSSLTGILNALTPLFALLFAVILFKNKLNMIQLLGLVVGFLGCVSLSFVSHDGGIGTFNHSVIFVILATICYALSANLIGEKLKNLRPVLLTALALLAMLPVAIIFLINSDVFLKLSTNPGAVVSLGYIAILGIFGTTVALLFFNRLIQDTSAVFASSVTYFIPIVAVLWGLVDGERLFAVHLIGMALIIAGVYIAGRKEMLSKK